MLWFGWGGIQVQGAHSERPSFGDAASERTTSAPLYGVVGHRDESYIYTSVSQE